MNGLAPRNLYQCERVIESGLNTFIAVGTALAEISSERLYRKTHPNFEAYCSERWGFSRQRAQQMIEAATVTTIVVTPLANEGQARAIAPLAKVDPEAANEVMADLHAEAEETGAPVTAAKITDAVKARQGSGEGAEDPDDAPLPAEPVHPARIITPHIEPEGSAELADMLADDPDIALAVWRANFARAIAREASAVLTFKAEDVAENASDDQLKALHTHADLLARWLTRVEAARPKGLRLVGGDR